jgi:pyruvate/oxaloacetate carboxyltransferase
MAEMTLSGVTIPTPAPYDAKDSTKQLENLCYVLLQVVQVVQGAGFKFGDVDKATKDGVDIKTAITNLSLSVPPADMTAIVQALKDLKYNGILIDFGVFRIEGFGKYKET